MNFSHMKTYFLLLLVCLLGIIPSLSIQATQPVTNDHTEFQQSESSDLSIIKKWGEKLKNWVQKKIELLKSIDYENIPKWKIAIGLLGIALLFFLLNVVVGFVGIPVVGAIFSLGGFLAILGSFIFSIISLRTEKPAHPLAIVALAASILYFLLILAGIAILLLFLFM